ncbi:MAG: hypothetical protein QM831_26295 [Kofleriaceae bacterium]
MKLVSFLFVCLAGMGCSEVKNAYDCAHICNRYQECFDDSYDVDKCESDCKANANSDDTYADKASSCQSCEDDNSCAGAAFNCADECIGIVP